jgi:hypothetical protein
VARREPRALGRRDAGDRDRPASSPATARRATSRAGRRRRCRAASSPRCRWAPPPARSSG